MRKKTGMLPPGIREATAEERDSFECWFTDPANQSIIDQWIAEAEEIATSEEGWIRVRRGTKTPA